jgi:transaldolase
MGTVAADPSVVAVAKELALEGFTPPGEKSFGSDPAWEALRKTGTLLWLDTGDLDAAGKLWTDEFSNLTTNNTLVNKEVQKGLFDAVISQAAKAFRHAQPGISDEDLITEIGFVVNCHTALRLVEAFDATVSVELHPGMSQDAERSLEYGRRYFAVCPEKFIVKVPLTPAGFVAARQLAKEGVPINYTLGFSARQNVIAAAFSRPAFVNVFMGRLNSFVKDSHLGDGKNIGERATMASQMALIEGRKSRGWVSQQIGASMRSGEQVADLAGLDVFTMPTAAAQEFKDAFHAGTAKAECQIGRDFPVEVTEPEIIGKLWEVDDDLVKAAEALGALNSDGWSGSDFTKAAKKQGLSALFREWSPDELREIRHDGKIPRWERWKSELNSGSMSLDDLMTQAALQSFVTDQSELDHRIREMMG